MEDEQIRLEISTHLTLGQWELARALILLYWNHAPNTEGPRAWITQLLLGICAHPEKSCIASLTIQSVQNLSFLALKLLEELKIDRPEVPLLKKAVEFKLYIYKASKLCSDIPYEDIRLFFETHQLRESEETTQETSLPDKIVCFLYKLKSKDALLASYIQRALLERFDEYSKDLSLTWIKNKCREIKNEVVKSGTNSTNDFVEELLAELRCFVFFFTELDKSLVIPEDVCEDLVILCDSGVIKKKVIYELLLINPFTAEKFCETEDKLAGRFGILDELDSAENFLNSVFLQDGVINAKELCVRCIRNKKHFLQMILDSLVVLVKSKKYNEVLNYFEYFLTSHIRPVVILKSWDQIANTKDAVAMLDHLWSNDLDKENYDPESVKACDELYQQVELAQWCIQQREKNPECATNVDCTFNSVRNSLKSKSVLRVLHEKLQISQLDQVEVEDVLKKYTTPMTSFCKKEKSVRFDTGLFEDCSYQNIQQSVDCKVFQSYRVMTSAMEAIDFCAQYNQWYKEKKHKKNENGVTESETWDALYEERVLKNLEKCNRLVSNLYPLSFRLEILGNLFSLVFATKNDLKNDTSSEAELSSDTDDFQSKDVGYVNNTHRKDVLIDDDDDDDDDEDEDGGGEEIDSGATKRFRRCSSDNASSMSTCSSGSSTSGCRYDFLCDEKVICALLNCVKNNLLDISLKFEHRRDIPNLVFWNDDGNCDVIKEKKFLQVVAELKKQVSDAIWRFEIVSSSVQRVNGTTMTEKMDLYRVFSEIRNGRPSRRSNKLASPHKCRRRCRSYLHSTYFEGCNNSSCSHGIVNKMLSCKESMLNLCMQQMDPIKAKQVIQTFDMENSEAAAEIIFAQKYSELVKQFQTPKTIFQPLLPSFSSSRSSLSSSLSQIQLTAAAGMNATVDATTVDDFLSRCNVPKVMGMEEYLRDSSKSHWNDLKECQDLKALVLCDLAFTTCQNLDSCSSLLHAAVKRIKSLTSGSQSCFSSHSGMKGLNQFAHQMLDLLSEVTRKQNSEMPLFTDTKFPKQNNLCGVFAQGLIPLEANKYSTEIESWNLLYVNLNDFYGAKRICEANEVTPAIGEARISMHKAFIMLVQNGTHLLRSRLMENPKISKQANYLRSIYIYLRQFATLKGHHNPEQKDSTSSHSFLDAFDEELTPTLIRMVAEEDVNLEWIEKFVQKFQINLPYIITQACVGVVPIRGFRSVEYRGHTVNKFGQYILNSSSSDIEKKKYNPEVVAKELLENLFNFVCENCEIVDEVVTEIELQKLHDDSRLSELLAKIELLSSVDLELLETEEQCLSFLLNVSNLLNLHSLLLRNYDRENIQFGKSRILAESCQVAYHIGQLNVISLFELRSLFGSSSQSGLQIPTEVLDVRKGVLGKILTIPNFKAIFLTHFGFSTSPKLQIITADNFNTQLNSAITDYLNAYVTVDSANKKVFVPELLSNYAVLSGENELSTILEYCSEDLQVSCKTAKDKNYAIVVRENDFRPSVVIDYSSTESQDGGSETKSERCEIVVKKLPQHVREYLKDKAWLVDYLIDILGGEDAENEKCAVLNRFVNQFEEMQRVDILIPAYHEVNFWLDLDEQLKKGDWTDVLEFINVSSTVRMEMRKFVTPLIDFILCHLFQSDKESVVIQRIKNVQLQAHCVLSLYKNLDFNKCKEYLLNVGTDQDLDKSLADEVILIWKRVEVYEEIKSVVPDPDYNRWQVIADLSEEDPEGVLTGLCAEQNYALALKWIQLHDIPEELRKLAHVVDLMQYLDKREPDVIKANIVLEQISEPSLTVNVCEDALNALDNLPSQVFLIEYLLNDLTNYVSNTRQDELHLMNMGIKILTSLPESDHKYFVELLSNPILMLEQLVMNMKIELLEKAVKIIANDITGNNKDSVKKMLKKYAKKSLEVQIIRPKVLPSSLGSAGMLLNKNESFTIPMYPPKKEDWIADETVLACMVCQIGTFHMFNRRHHCRRCGRVVCASCSQHRAIVQGYDDVNVRICDDCKELCCSSNSNAAYASSLEKRIRYYGSGNPRSSSISSIASLTLPCTQLGDEIYFWQLKLNEEHNSTVREEFNFEQTPNVSLCISLLDCYMDDDESAIYLWELSEELFSVLQPTDDSGMPNPEVNHNMIMNVIETLILSAKFKFANSSNQKGMATCDVCLTNLHLVQMLITSNCYRLVPRHGISSNDGVRRLRDQLVDEERWSLALEVTTKNPLDPGGVWFSWGFSILKTENFPAAREKFSHCFEKPSERGHAFSSDTPLSEIIKLLEMNLYRKEDETINIRNSLASIKDIKKQGGKAFLLPKIHGPQMNLQIFDECLYYLRTYGTHSMILSFLLKHDKLNIALKHVLDKDCDTETFINSIFLPCIRRAKLDHLEQELMRSDSTLKKWQRYLNAVCMFLHRQRFLHTLLEVQIFCQDYVRAYSTCVSLFMENATEYGRLYNQKDFLIQARKHLLTAQQLSEGKPDIGIKQPTWIHSAASLQKTLSLKEIQTGINTIDRQLEITEYFHKTECDVRKLLSDENSGDKTRVRGVPTVFGNAVDQTELAAMVILAGKNVSASFELCYKIIQQFRLDSMRVFSLTGRQLVKRHKFDECHQLINCVESSGEYDAQLVDEVIASCLLVLGNDPVEKTAADNLIKRITSNQHKIDAYIRCRKFRSAYLLAIKNKDVPAVQRIYSAAKREEATMKNTSISGAPSDVTTTINMCEQWLAKQT